MDYRTLRRYVRAHPDSLQFLEEQTKDHLDQSHSVLIASAPAVAERLLQIALDPNTKNYAAVSACQAVFAIIDKGVTDRENAEQLRAIRESLNALEGGRVIDVWALILNRKLKLTVSEVIHNLLDKKRKI